MRHWHSEYVHRYEELNMPKAKEFATSGGDCMIVTRIESTQRIRLKEVFRHKHVTLS